MDKRNLIIGMLIAVVIIIGGYSVLKKDSPVGAPSGPAHYQMESFLQGVSAGARDQFSVSNTGVVTTQLNILEKTGTSTISVAATAASTGARIILEDSDGAGCSELYVLNGTVISAIVTCP